MEKIYETSAQKPSIEATQNFESGTSLGSNTKKVAKISVAGSKKDQKTLQKQRDSRRKRDIAQKNSRDNLIELEKEDYIAEGKNPDDYFWGQRQKTIKCIHTPIGLDVRVLKSAEYKKAHYKNLVVCGRVWSCPNCAHRIQQKRREEVALAFDYAEKNGLFVSMVTLTFSHSKNDSLSTNMENMAKATKSFNQQINKKFKKNIGFVGSIRALEVTYSDKNGWHPHNHIVYISEKKLSDEDTILVKKAWKNACSKNGLLDLSNKKAVLNFDLHATHVAVNMVQKEYLAKFDDPFEKKEEKQKDKGNDLNSLSYEIASNSTKIGRKAGGLHPHELLMEKSIKNRRLFNEFVRSFKGKKQLNWSHGLKKLVGIEDKTDEEVVQEEEDKAEDEQAIISLEEWRLVLKNNKRVRLLEAMEDEGAMSVRRIVENLTRDEINGIDEDLRYLLGFEEY